VGLPADTVVLLGADALLSRPPVMSLLKELLPRQPRLELLEEE
jgi:hypothetical protein